MNSVRAPDADPADPPLPQRAVVAVAVAPVCVLLALTLVIGDLIGADLGFAAVAAAITWLVYEMHRWQRALALADTADTLPPCA